MNNWSTNSLIGRPIEGQIILYSFGWPKLGTNWTAGWPTDEQIILYFTYRQNKFTQPFLLGFKIFNSAKQSICSWQNSSASELNLSSAKILQRNSFDNLNVRGSRPKRIFAMNFSSQNITPWYRHTALSRSSVQGLHIIASRFPIVFWTWSRISQNAPKNT